MVWYFKYCSLCICKSNTALDALSVFSYSTENIIRSANQLPLYGIGHHFGHTI